MSGTLNDLTGRRGICRTDRVCGPDSCTPVCMAWSRENYIEVLPDVGTPANSRRDPRGDLRRGSAFCRPAPLVWRSSGLCRYTDAHDHALAHSRTQRLGPSFTVRPQYEAGERGGIREIDFFTHPAKLMRVGATLTFAACAWVPCEAWLILAKRNRIPADAAETLCTITVRSSHRRARVQMIRDAQKQHAPQSDEGF